MSQRVTEAELLARIERGERIESTEEMTEEYRLSQRITAKLNPWQRQDGHLPSELDKDVLFMFQALFEKSAAPPRLAGSTSR